MSTPLKSILADGDYDTLVACDAEQIVGFIGTRVGPLYESDSPYGQIMASGVATEYQRRGIGRSLTGCRIDLGCAQCEHLGRRVGKAARAGARALREERLHVYRPPV